MLGLVCQFWVWLVPHQNIVALLDINVDVLTIAFDFFDLRVGLDRKTLKHKGRVEPIAIQLRDEHPAAQIMYGYLFLHDLLKIAVYCVLTTAGCFAKLCRQYSVAKCYFFLLSTSSWIMGVSITSMAKPIFPPGTTMVLGRDIKES